MSSARGLLDGLLHASNQSRPFVTICKPGGARTYSVSEVFDGARRYASYYQRSGCTAGDIVFIMLHHGIDQYQSFIGAMLCGAIPSFLPYPSTKHDPEYWAATHREVFMRTDAACVVCPPNLLDDLARLVQGLGTRVLCTASLPAEMMAQPDAPHPERIALLQHSSGTTGLKKGVMLSYRAITAQLDFYGAALGIGREDDFTVATWLPLYHDMGLISSFLLPLHRGGHIVALDPFDWVQKPVKLFEIIEHYAATHAWLPNFAFQHLVRTVPRKRDYDLTSMRAFISCSEPCKADSFRRFADRFSAWGAAPETLSTCYAMAETVFAMAQSPPGQPVRVVSIDPRRLSIGDTVLPSASDGLEVLSNGPAIAGLEIEIRVDGQAVGEGRIGEICVRSTFLFSGYFRNAAATAEALSGDLFQTGDIGFLDQGDVFILGRIKDIIILNGKNIYAHDVEEVASEVAGLKPGRSVAFGIYDPLIASERLVVVAESAEHVEDSAALVAEVAERVKARFEMAVGDVRIVAPGWLTKTTSGKISRADNKGRYLLMTDCLI